MSTTPVRTLVAIAAAAVLSVGITSAAQADDETTTTDAPCAAQEAQVVKAEAALARVTAVFEAHGKADQAKNKKAQLQRVAKAEARLAACVAAQPA